MRSVSFSIAGLWVLAFVAGSCAAPQRRVEEPERIRVGSPVLWCAEPQGKACRAAAAALGVEPMPTATLPAAAVSPVVDMENDCEHEGVAEIMAGLTERLGMDPANWHDNGDTGMTAERVRHTYEGAGCTNCCWDEGEPTLKVHAATGKGRGYYLIRVWEVGSE